ncbi:MAG: hypothetical protein QOH78_2564, partial [Verrucomicrobiota bacterium]
MIRFGHDYDFEVFNQRKNGGVNTRTPSIPKRVAALDWDAMAADLDKYGVTTLKCVLTPEECRSIASMYE